MATETATAAAPAAAPAKAAAAADAPAHAVRPTRPDENAFKEALAKAEKDHKGSMDRLVIANWAADRLNIC